jgi:oligoendopeptidase F
MSEKLPEKWDLAHLFASDEAWQQEFDALHGLVQKMEAWQGRRFESGAVFFAYIEESEAVELRMEILYQYAQLLHTLDTADAGALEMVSKVEWLFSLYSQITSFFFPAFKEIAVDTLEQWLDEAEDKSFYRRMIEVMNRRRPYILTDKEERLLAQSGEALSAVSSTYNLLVNADMTFKSVMDAKGKRHKVDEAVFTLLARSNDRELRKKAFASLTGSYYANRNTFAQLLTGNAKVDEFAAKARGYGSTIEAKLYQDELTTDFYTDLLQSVEKLLPLSKQYVGMKREVLGLDQIAAYDLYAPMVEEVDKERIPYPASVDLICQALVPLGEDYVEEMRSGMQQGWVDVDPGKNKQKGAFMSNVWSKHPFVLLNHTDSFQDVLTLAHEMGHAMHSHYTNKAQPYAYSGHSIITAEVASITNELIVLRFLINREDNKIKKQRLINQLLEGFRTTVFRQSLFAEFEKDTHAKAADGGTLTSDWLLEEWGMLYSKYYGEDLLLPQEFLAEWARIPHFYSSFYVYKYVLGFLTASFLAEKIVQGDVVTIERYRNFLAAGNSAAPLKLLEDVGVDLKNPAVAKAAGHGFEVSLREML